jgi:hypothetical protein
MPTPREVAVADLRRSIDVLPERTRNAMLIGLQNNTVITGAFTGGGGVCPMMAAHREGGRTTCVSFPEAWDKFTGVYGRAICRPATEYEVGILRMQIEESLEPQASPLAEAIAEHTAMVEGRRRRDRRYAGQPVDLGEAIHEHESAKRRDRLFAGTPIDLRGAIEDYKSSARRRRSDEATEVGLDWLFEETLVLPDDFDAVRAVEPEFDFDAAEGDVYAR